MKQKQEADKHIMQMNIFCDYEGYIYFNELFFFFFKFSLEEKLNEIEPNRTPEKNFTALSIVRKEEVISLKKINFLKKKVPRMFQNIFRANHLREILIYLFVIFLPTAILTHETKNYTQEKRRCQSHGEEAIREYVLLKLVVVQ